MINIEPTTLFPYFIADLTAADLPDYMTITDLPDTAPLIDRLADTIARDIDDAIHCDPSDLIALADPSLDLDAIDNDTPYFAICDALATIDTRPIAALMIAHFDL